MGDTDSDSSRQTFSSALPLLRRIFGLVRPFLVKAVVDSKGEITELKRPLPPVGYIVKPEVAEWVVDEALVGVVNEGTGKRAKLEKWQVFGKVHE